MSLGDKVGKALGDSGVPSGKLFCSFCGKDQNKVAKLIAGPSVFICDECVDRCNDILEKECEPEVRAGGSASEATTNVVSSCVLCHLPKPGEELLAVPDRGLICALCVEAIRAAAQNEEEG